MPESEEVVPLDLPDGHREILREECLEALQGILDDLAEPDRLPDPARTAREGELFRRLLESLGTGRISLPDEEMRARIVRLAESWDEIMNAEEVIATHQAHQALLEVLGRTQPDPGDDEAVRSPAPGWLVEDPDDCPREILWLLLKEAPAPLTFADIATVLAGDPEDQKEANALRDAIQVLVSAGLARRQDGTLVPTRPAREMADLGFAIG